MNLILLISLSVAILLAVVDFLSGNKRMWIRFSFCVLSIVALTAVYSIYKEEASRLVKSRSEASSSKELLKKAETLMSEKSDILSGELAKIQQAIIADNKTDTTVKHSLIRLEHHVKSLQKNSRQLQAEIMEAYSERPSDALLPYSSELRDGDGSRPEEPEVISEGNN